MLCRFSFLKCYVYVQFYITLAAPHVVNNLSYKSYSQNSFLLIGVWSVVSYTINMKTCKQLSLKLSFNLAMSSVYIVYY